MQLVESAAFFPSTCICGEAHGPMADTSIEKYGERLYLCKRCVRDAGREFEMVEQSDLVAVTERLADAQDAILDLEGQVSELQPVRDAVARAAERWGELEPDDEPVRPKAPRTRQAAA